VRAWSLQAAARGEEGMTASFAATRTAATGRGIDG